MLEITSFKVENLGKGCVTDEGTPRFSWSVKCDKNDIKIKEAILTVNGWKTDAMAQIGISYAGATLSPFTEYEATIKVVAADGDMATDTLTFETGMMGKGFKGQWITDGNYSFNEDKVSPVPMVFKKNFHLNKKIKSVKLYATAIGIYQLSLNGKRVGKDYFTPGFTSYKTNLQYQTYDITQDVLANGENTLYTTVSGGWAVGSFVFTRKNRITADRQAFLADIRVTFEDGSVEYISTDDSWYVSMKGNVRAADIYDGEIFDASISLEDIPFHKAAIENVKIHPRIMAQYSNPVRVHEQLSPISINRVGNDLIYDFGQNLAGIVAFKIDGKKGQKVIIRHAEILKEEGSLNRDFLRTAKAELIYTCKDGIQEYSPNFTYMGFRYVSVSGVDEDKIEIKALALYSDVEEIGDFSCSNDMINRLQQNIKWGTKSNFVEIPTDCPQRDERMGWTGDIALFAPTACFNFDNTRFLRKWLKDMRAEQLMTGGIPNTIPSQGYGFPATMPVMAIDFWGDASVLVPWAIYQATGDETVLRENYEMMKKYVSACTRWASLFSFGKRKYIWHTPSVFHFGDWVAPDVPQMSQWQKRSKWTATASLANTSQILSKIAAILGETQDERKYKDLYEKVSDAYESIFTDKNGKLLEEFQTAYVLPIYFDMFSKEIKQKAAINLATLVRQMDYKIGTGFPGTPYILFALADNGQEETAFKMLMNTNCPSWLYEVKMGATTIWERWDGLDENGNCPIGDDGTDTMISYNHYASGAVGDFLYRRVAGIEATSAGYKTFRVKPIVGGGLTHACGVTKCSYGEIKSEWSVENGLFEIKVSVPVNTTCELILPNEDRHILSNGNYSYSIEFAQVC